MVSVCAETGPFEVVASVAQVLGESLDFHQVFARAAEVAQNALTFDRMSVLRHEGEHLRVYAVAPCAGDPCEGRLVPRTDFSPRFWRSLSVDRIAERDLVPAYPVDREM